jgi:hypothetical protein
MSSRSGGTSDNQDTHEPAPMVPDNHGAGEPPLSAPYADIEPGWKAARSLMHLRSDALLAVMLRPSFQPVRNFELVPVTLCPYCCDGGLRVAGTVRASEGRVLVRACDTCAAVDIGRRPAPRNRRAPNTPDMC